MIHNGDCLEILKTLPDESLDSLVTDPPAGIGFMGKDWDSDKGGRDHWIAWLTEVMRECHRVLKPGAHGLVWALPRTSHWTATALENAGFEIRDVVTHLFGTGFPKSLDISKAIDKAAGVKRAVVGNAVPGKTFSEAAPDKTGSHIWSGELTSAEAVTDDARKWQGWGTALKPASEHWILIRKPLSEKTVAANVLKHGTGGINVDACRVGTDSTARTQRGTTTSWEGGAFSGEVSTGSPQGRFPANLVLSHSPECVQVGTKDVKGANGGGMNRDHKTGDTHIGVKRTKTETVGYAGPDGTETVEAWDCVEACAVRMLDEQSGTLHGRGNKGSGVSKTAMFGKAFSSYGAEHTRADAGGASRFFYCAKASKSDRNRSVKDGKARDREQTPNRQEHEPDELFDSAGNPARGHSA